MAPREEDGSGLEELEELEPLGEEAGTAAAGTGGTLLADPGVMALIRSFSTLLFPMALLDTDLRFVTRNEAFEALLRRFDYQDRPSFPALFYHALGQDAVREMRESLMSPSRDYSWKGVISHTVRHASKEITKAIILPYQRPETGSTRPLAYTVLFDDITGENQQMLTSMFQALLEASKKKDQDTGEHVNRVNLYSRAIAERLYDDPAFPQVDQDFISDIAFLAAMHDVGKIGTPDDILHKPGKLEPWEWTVMKEHTLNGAYILATYPNPMARDIARSHHEMWDGNGYPYQLEGEFIPLSARIVTIADVYDALRSKRPYKEPLTHEEAARQIVAWKGSHFDPRLVAIFESLEAEFDRFFTENE